MADSKKIGLTIFDIDETLFHTKAKVQVTKEGKFTKSSNEVGMADILSAL